MKKIKILIVDDHKLIRETWTLILNAEPGLQVIGDYPTAEQALEVVGNLKPDVVILDINLPGMNGLEATSQILARSPASRILGVSMHTQPAYAKQMIKRGAMGYLTKSSPRREMLHALKEILAGRKYICKEVNEILANQFMEGKSPVEKTSNVLSVRQVEIVELIKKGYSSKEIASALHLSQKTVEVHRYNILKKLGLPNTAALINFINRNYSGES